MDDASMDVGESEVPTIISEGEFLVVESEQMEECGMQIVHMDFILYGMVAEFVGFAKGEAGFYPSSSEEQGETIGIVIASGSIFLGIWSPAEFAAPPDQSILQESALFEILEQTCDGLVGVESMKSMFREVRMLIPARVIGIVAVIDLDIPHPSFGQSPGHEALFSEVVRSLFTDAVHRLNMLGFFAEIKDVWSMALHIPSEFIGIYDRFKL